MKANTTGKAIENLLAENLRGLGLEFEQQRRVGFSVFHLTAHPWPLQADFVVTNLVAFPRGLAVEVKWQDTPGSVDEKFHYLAANIKTQYDVPAIVVAAGGGCRPGALAWLRSQVDGRQFVAVYRLDEFISWALRSEKIRRPRLFDDLEYSA